MIVRWTKLGNLSSLPQTNKHETTNRKREKKMKGAEKTKAHHDQRFSSLTLSEYLKLSQLTLMVKTTYYSKLF